MSSIPEPMLQKRRQLSDSYLSGQGIEIGALHHPLWVSEQATVRYVDRLSREDLRRHYPELKEYPLVPVQVIDDGESLSSIQDGSLDFIIANHMLEHCENPLGTIRTHMRKLRRAGILYYAIPDQRYGFDNTRPLTSFEHLVHDDQHGPEASRKDHFYEWSSLVNKNTHPEEIKTEVQKLMELNYSIHFHVWDSVTFKDFLVQAQAYLRLPVNVIHFGQNDTEIIVILKKEPPQYFTRLNWTGLRSCLSRLRIRPSVQP